jgi:glycosyltransferase involved in cell wall biosynthesis
LDLSKPLLVRFAPLNDIKETLSKSKAKSFACTESGHCENQQLTDTTHVTIVHPNLHIIGGAERLMSDLAVGLADDETTVEIVTGLSCNNRRAEFREAGSILKEVGWAGPGTVGFWANVNQFAKALSGLINPKADIIITSSFPASLAAQMFTKKHPTKVAHYLHEAPMVLHDDVGRRTLSYRRRLLYGLVSRVHAKRDIEAVQQSDWIIANSQLTKMANSLAYGVDESRIEVVYPGVNVQRLTSSAPAPEQRNASDNLPLIFVPRGAQAWRNPEICLRALAKQTDRRLRALFTGGEKREGGSLKKLANTLGVADRIRWVPELSDGQLNELYSRSLAVISIPKRQPFGLIPLEGLVCGSPSIISRFSGVAEVLHDGTETTCIHAREPEELACAIESLVFDVEKRRVIVTNGRKKVLEHLTSTRFAQEMREKLVH